MAKKKSSKGDTRWFVHDRFGMFIHWGIYALAGRHEWVMNREEIPADVYERKYFRNFNPDLYDPAEWAAAARRAGMKYFVVTTKHHDGFCLWDTKLTDYKATNTPYRKDLIRPMVEAFRAEGLKVGFYHSLIDWHHPHFPIDMLHPLRNHPRARAMNKKRDIRKYTEYLHGQVTELLTEYGPVDIMWFDFSYSRFKDAVHGFKGKGRKEWQSEKLIKLVRKLQPNILINNRTELEGDFRTPEQAQPREWIKANGKRVTWEACQTFSGSWGYARDETTWKSPEQLVQMLINCVARGGSLLMNVGPTGRGTFDERALNALDAYAKWIRLHSRSIYGCTQSKFVEPPEGRYTQNGKRLYLHVFNWPFGRIHLEGLAHRMEYAQLLNDASEVRWMEPDDMESFGGRPAKTDAELARRKKTAVLQLPIVKPDVVVPVVEIFLK